jgi:hypothetical protein
MEIESRLHQASLRPIDIVIQLIYKLQATTFFGIHKMELITAEAMEAVAREQSRTITDKLKEDESESHMTCGVVASSGRICCSLAYVASQRIQIDR